MWKAVAKRFKNINYIFPTKQKYIAELVEKCKRDRNIKKLIVFGSAVTGRCNIWSDIDLYYEFDEEPKKYPFIDSNHQVFDNFSNFSVSEEFYKEICRKGVIVYER